MGKGRDKTSALYPSVRNDDLIFISYSLEQLYKHVCQRRHPHLILVCLQLGRRRSCPRTAHRLTFLFLLRRIYPWSSWKFKLIFRSERASKISDRKHQNGNVEEGCRYVRVLLERHLSRIRCTPSRFDDFTASYSSCSRWVLLLGRSILAIRLITHVRERIVACQEINECQSEEKDSHEREILRREVYLSRENDHWMLSWCEEKADEERMINRETCLYLCHEFEW